MFFGCSLKKFQFQPSGSAALLESNQVRSALVYVWRRDTLGCVTGTHSDNTVLGLPVVDPLFKVRDSVVGT